MDEYGEIEEGSLGYLPSALSYGEVSRTTGYDPSTGAYYDMYQLRDASGNLLSFPIEAARDRGLRGALPPEAVELMFSIIGNRTGEILGGPFRVRDRFVYQLTLTKYRDFGPALVLRDMVERNRRSQKRRRKMLNRVSLTDEDGLRNKLARYVAAEYAGTMLKLRPRMRFQDLLAEGLKKVEKAMERGSPYTIAVL